jgi:hypothetical protein
MSEGEGGGAGTARRQGCSNGSQAAVQMGRDTPPLAEGGERVSCSGGA